MDKNNSKWRLVDRDGDSIYTYALEIKDLGCLVRVSTHGSQPTLSFVPGTELVQDDTGDWKLQAIPLPPLPYGFGGPGGGGGGQILIPMMR